MADPVSTWVQDIFEFLLALPLFVTKLYTPPSPSLVPGNQFWTVDYLISEFSRATNSTTAACSCEVFLKGAVQPSRYET